MKEQTYLSLEEINKYEKQMQELKVAEVARSPTGFLNAYKRVCGDANKLPQDWRFVRKVVVVQHLALYRKNPTLRRKLALIAWAYMPLETQR